MNVIVLEHYFAMSLRKKYINLSKSVLYTLFIVGNITEYNMIMKRPRPRLFKSLSFMWVIWLSTATMCHEVLLPASPKTCLK